MIHSRRATWLFCAIGLLTFCSLSGCGTSQYETLLAKEIKTIRNGAPWARFWDYTTLPDTPVKVRVPEMFKTSYQLTSPHPQDNGDRIAHTRAQPPFIDLPGFRLVYEDFYNEGQTRAPYYCYLAAQKATPQQAQAIAADLLNKLKPKFPAPDPDTRKWEDVDCKTPDGGVLTWKKLTLVGDQFFAVDSGVAGGVEERAMPGTFELWLYEGQGYCVLIGWRINSQWDKTIGLLKMAPLTAGTVQISEAAAAAPAP